MLCTGIKEIYNYVVVLLNKNESFFSSAAALVQAGILINGDHWAPWGVKRIWWIDNFKSSCLDAVLQSFIESKEMKDSEKVELSGRTLGDFRWREHCQAVMIAEDAYVKC